MWCIKCQDGEMDGLAGGHCRSRLAKDECCRMPFLNGQSTI